MYDERKFWDKTMAEQFLSENLTELSELLPLRPRL